jgi:hypothetical protein
MGAAHARPGADALHLLRANRFSFEGLAMSTSQAEKFTQKGGKLND